MNKQDIIDADFEDTPSGATVAYFVVAIIILFAGIMYAVIMWIP